MRSVTIVAEEDTWPQLAPAKAAKVAKVAKVEKVEKVEKVAKVTVARVSMGPREDGKQKVDGRRRAARERKGKEQDTKEKGIKAHVSTAERWVTKLGNVGVKCLCGPRKDNQKQELKMIVPQSEGYSRLAW